MSDPSIFNVIQLKDFLRTRALSTTGTKPELIARLMDADPSGEWMGERSEDDVRDVCNGGGRRKDFMYRRELEVCTREKEIAERELQLSQPKIALLRGRQDASSASHERREIMPISGGTHPRLKLVAIANLLAEFDGSTGDFDTWEMQVRLLKTTYQLEDDYAKILVRMKLKKKALEWFHSKPELISLNFNGLLDELRMMF